MGQENESIQIAQLEEFLKPLQEELDTIYDQEQDYQSFLTRISSVDLPIQIVAHLDTIYSPIRGTGKSKIVQTYIAYHLSPRELDGFDLESLPSVYVFPPVGRGTSLHRPKPEYVTQLLGYEEGTPGVLVIHSYATPSEWEKAGSLSEPDYLYLEPDLQNWFNIKTVGRRDRFTW
jgi:hypothetical protein